MMPQIIGLFLAAPFPGIPAPLFESDTSKRARKKVKYNQQVEIFWFGAVLSLVGYIDTLTTYKDTLII